MADVYASYPVVGSSGGVTSLNSETGAITLTAGTGIAITTPTSSTIQIASTSAGDVTLGAFGSTPNANGLSISGSQVLNMQPADGTNPGGVSILAQTFAGTKTFANIIDSGLTASQAVVTDGSKQLTSLAYASANTASALVQRDGSGNFSAGTITASLTGTASNATQILTTSTTSNASYAPTFVDTTATQQQNLRVGSANITMNPSTGIFTATGFVGDLTGTASGNTTISGQTNHGVVIASATNAMGSTGAGTSGQVLTSNGASADPTFQDIGMPSGVVLPYGGASAPTGWLLCDGAAINRTTYAALFAVIGTTYGVGNGSTTFNIPNTQGVFLRGAGTQTISAINYSGTAGAVAGDTFQGHYHTLTDPGHNHTQNSHTHTQDTHTHTQNSHTHTQDAHTHIQDAHKHGLATNDSGVSDTGFGTGTASLNNSTASGSTIGRSGSSGNNVTVISNTTPTNQNATATNQSTTATNQNTIATNQSTTATNISTTTGATVVAAITNGSNGTPRIASETVPASLGINYIIKT